MSERSALEVIHSCICCSLTFFARRLEKLKDAMNVGRESLAEARVAEDMREVTRKEVSFGCCCIHVGFFGLWNF